tara:strand:- start:84 stop:1163 length:1080 start_codon:yes stop_codon:yes gene_type:complete
MNTNNKSEDKPLSKEELKQLKLEKIQASYDNLHNILVENVDTGLKFNNKRIMLLVACSEIALNNLKEFKIVRNTKTDHIEDKQIKSWIEKLYNKTLKPRFSDLVFKKFRVEKRVYFDALKDIALSVQFMIGNFKGGSKSLDKIPYCKIMLNQDKGIDMKKGIINFNSDDWEKAIYQFEETNYKLFIRPSSINLCNKELVKDKLRIDDKSLDKTAFVYDCTITEIRDFANKVINFSKPNEDNKGKGKTWQSIIKEDIDNLTTKFVNARTDKKINTFFKGNAKDNMHNMISDFIKTSVVKGHYSEVFELVNEIHRTIKAQSKTNKSFKNYIESNKQVFAYKHGLDENSKGQLLKYGISIAV